MPSGVLMTRMNQGAITYPTAISTKPPARQSATVLCTALLSFLKSFAPKIWEITTPEPTDIPPKKPTRQVTSRLLAPMAAEADLPMKLPTKMRSTVLYSCCTRLPTSSGSANKTSCLPMGPSVRSPF